MPASKQKKHPQTISQLLKNISQNTKTNELSISQLAELFQYRSFGLLLITFCAIPALPVPSQGIATILAIPVILLALQLIAGRTSPWIPKRIAAKTISTKKIKHISNLLLPTIKRFEVLSKPRLSYMSSKTGERIVGIFTLIFAISMALPIPFSNTIPSLAIIIMALGMLEKDGIAIKIGIIVGCLGILLTATIYLLGIEAVAGLWNYLKH